MLLNIMHYYGVVLLAFLLVLPIAYGDTTIVYDNSTTPTQSVDPIWVPDGFLDFNRFGVYHEGEEDAMGDLMGDQVTLAGTNREVMKFDLYLSSTTEDTLSRLTLAFYTLSTIDGYPDAEIWSTTLYDVNVDGPTIVSFVVPNVTVPDTFVWAAGSVSDVAGLATFNPPTIGESGDYYWDYSFIDGPPWWGVRFDGDPIANFGATIWATPEPATICSLLVSGVFLVRRKRGAMSNFSTPPRA